MRRCVLWAALALLGATPLSAEEVPPAREDVFLTRAAALREVFGAGAHVSSTRLRLDDNDIDVIQKRMRRRLFEREFQIYRSKDDAGATSGYAIITEEIGKYQPITFIVGVGVDGAVQQISVMVYRESHGGEVRRQRFLRQFRGKSLEHKLRVSHDIINISGATLSALAITRGTRKVLAAIERLHSVGVDDRQWREVALPAPESARSALLRRCRYAMGTFLEIQAYGADSETLATVFTEVERLEQLLSTYRTDSELARVNRDAAQAPVVVSSDTFDCVAAALRFAEESGGAFDPTLQDGGYRRVRLDVATSSIRFVAPQQSKRATAASARPIALDLGGIGKGYALDRAAELLRERGVGRALLNFGGQILALDAPPKSDGWLVALRDPADPRDWLGYLCLAGGSVSTTASYERGAHVIDPSSGLAVTALTATVVRPDATSADAWSTAAGVLGSSVLEGSVMEDRAAGSRGLDARSSAALAASDSGLLLLVGDGVSPRVARGARAPRLWLLP